jgi:lipopolysaccharide transport system ATP-binding protein
LREAFGRLSPRRPELPQPESLLALDQISFEVPPGEMTAIIGANGAGKSTILKLIGNVIAPTRGEVSVRGRVASLLELGAGFHPDLSGRDNIYLNAAILGMRRREVASKFDSIVAFAELDRFVDTPIKRYSSGMWMRLAFAIAVHVRPDILLVDEVLAVGDRAFQEKSLAKASELQAEARTVLFVSHNLAAVQALCTRGIFLDQGKILFDGPVREALAAYERYLIARGSISKAPEVAAGPARSWHSSGLRLQSVELCNASGRAVESMPLGSQFSVRVTYHAERRIEAPIFSVEIRRSDGLVCARVSSHFDRFEIECIESRGQMQVDFAPAWLAPGVYTVTARIFDQGHAYTLASWVDAAAFRIAGEDDVLTQRDALLDVPHRWCVPS